MKQIVLGLNAFHADASAAIFLDGELIAASEEERFVRKKHYAGFPLHAIQFCLDEVGCTLNDVHAITIGRDPNAKLARKIRHLILHPHSAARLLNQRLSNRSDLTTLHDQFGKIQSNVDPQLIRSKLHFIEHHRSHLASAFYPSRFHESAILSVDGSGDFTTTMLAHGKGTEIHVLESLDFPNSIGFFYTAFTQYLGFPNFGDEYKLMGLAPYGDPKYTDKVARFLKLIDGGLFELHSSSFRFRDGIVSYPNQSPQVAQLFGDAFASTFGPARLPNAPITQYHCDLAASVQSHTQEALFHVLRRLHQLTQSERLCIAGGVAQNSVAVGRITQNTPFKEVFAPPAGHDAGISIGSALFYQHAIAGKHRNNFPPTAYLGSRFSPEEVSAFLNSAGIPFRRHTALGELVAEVSDSLIAGNVVGWFQGRAEFGPRALGGRSILMDPRRADAKEILNSKIKRREDFRPFAPSVLSAHTQEWFENAEFSPFMERVLRILPEKRPIIPAVTHVDGTGRLQSVTPQSAPEFHALIEDFYMKTGVPMLLNTSFNENEPIVNSLQDALSCFLRTGMDVLVLEYCVIKRF